jgi:hypothetical protein
MNNSVSIVKTDEGLSLCFYIEHDKLLSIGEKINELNENAYMNGYNWEAFFNYYLSKYHPEICINMRTDPEAGMYVACYDLSRENEVRAKKFVEIITDLIENEKQVI